MAARDILKWFGWSLEETAPPEAVVEPAPDPLFNAAARAKFEANGFIVLRGLISPERCDAVVERIDSLWRGENVPPISIDVFLERPDGGRLRMTEAPAEARSWPYKINDMVMHDETVREVALDPALCTVVREVIRGDPVAIGSLNFERGSTQRYHTDTLYMPGKSEDGMTAAWIALEDVSPDAGPLLYYPGSHAIPLYRFSNGGCNQVDTEMDSYTAYMDGGCAERGLTPETFLPKKGDVLIWHERLYHGGAPIVDPTLTRKSLVVHYWREEHMRDRPLQVAGGGYYWDRPPL